MPAGVNHQRQIAIHEKQVNVDFVQAAIALSICGLNIQYIRMHVNLIGKIFTYSKKYSISGIRKARWLAGFIACYLAFIED